MRASKSVLSTLVIGLVLCAAAFPMVMLATWTDLGGSGSFSGIGSAGGSTSIDVSVALDEAARPAVAWQDPATYLIHVRRWNGSQWDDLGAAGPENIVNAGLDPVMGSDEPIIAMDSSWNPVVAWSGVVGFGSFDIYLRKWTGTAWMELGSSGSGGGLSDTPGGFSKQPALAIDAGGNPVVAWSEYGEGTIGGSSDIKLRRWSGGSWIELGGSATLGGLSSNPGGSVQPSLALDAAGKPIVAWQDDSKIYLRRWNGILWEELGGSATGWGISGTAGGYLPALALDATGNPVLAWETATPEIVVKKWVDGVWVGLGGSVPGFAAAIAVDALDRVTVTRNYAGEVYARTWSGQSWTSLGSAVSATPASPSKFAALALDGGGNPVVAWEEGSTSRSVYLKRWGEAVPFDQTPPSAVVDLEAEAIGATTLKLTWTAAGDDGILGWAAGYDLRYAESPPVDSNEASLDAWFAEAVPVDAGTPLAPGQIQSLAASSLVPGRSYYWVLRTIDNVGNASALSNVAVATLAGAEAPAKEASSGGGCGGGAAGGVSLAALAILLIAVALKID